MSKNPMKINMEVTRPAVDIVPTMEDIKARFGIADTLGYEGIEDVKMAQDALLSGNYNLLQHTINSGLFEDCPQFIGYGVLSGLTQNGLIRAGVEMRADEMIRKWIELTYNGQDYKTKRHAEEQDLEAEEQDPEAEEPKEDEGEKLIPALNAEIDRFRIKKLFRDAAAMCGYYGGCLAYIDIGDPDEEELKTPLRLDADTFRRGELHGFRLIEPFNVAPGRYNATSPLSKSYFKPRAWYILGQEVHASRFLYFSEDRPPSLLLPAYNFFGIPLAQTVLDTVSHFTKCREATARLLEKFSLTVMKTDMQALLSGGTDGDIQRRIQYFIQNRNNDGLMVVDNETEDIINLTTPLGGCTDIVRQCMEMVAAYFGEPVVKLWGISPAGFNSTGEADMQNHYDHINSLQERIMRTPLNKLLKILQMNKFGRVDNALTFNFLPIGDDNDLTVAQVQQTKANTMTALFDRGIIDGEEARRSLAEDVKSPFTNIDPNKEIEPPGSEQEGDDGMGGLMDMLGGSGKEENDLDSGAGRDIMEPAKDGAPYGNNNASKDHVKKDDTEARGISPQGENMFSVRGFAKIQKRNNHFSKHRSDYPEIKTPEELERMALKYLESATNDNLVGHIDKDGVIVRYDKSKNIFVKGHPDKGIRTLYKPREGLKYYIDQKKEDISHGGKE